MKELLVNDLIINIINQNKIFRNKETINKY